MIRTHTPVVDASTVYEIESSSKHIWCWYLLIHAENIQEEIGQRMEIVYIEIVHYTIGDFGIFEQRLYNYLNTELKSNAVGMAEKRQNKTWIRFNGTADQIPYQCSVCVCVYESSRALVSVRVSGVRECVDIVQYAYQRIWWPVARWEGNVCLCYDSNMCVSVCADIRNVHATIDRQLTTSNIYINDIIHRYLPAICKHQIVCTDDKIYIQHIKKSSDNKNKRERGNEYP